MAAPIAIRGKEKVLAYFKKVNNPFWKLYNTSDTKRAIQENLSNKDIAKSFGYLADLLESIESTGVYQLDTFSVKEANEAQRFITPTTSLVFSMSESAISGETTELKSGAKWITDTPASLKDHIALVQENAKLSVEVNMHKAECMRLMEEISKLKVELDYANNLLDEYEEEDEEDEEEQGVTGTGDPKNMNEAISQLISKHGGTLIEGLFGKGKSKMEDIPEEETDNAEVNGIEERPMPKNITGIIEELRTHDENLFKHLYKLLQIARSQPVVFKNILTQLESF